LDERIIEQNLIQCMMEFQKDSVIADTSKSVREQNRPLSVAPMVNITDRHFRYFMRQLTRYTLLYTPMIATGALIYGKKYHLLEYSDIEKPLALQLGGDNPAHLAECAHLAEDYNYDEVNLNVGCPSERVQQGHFGACLMAKPEVVARCVEAMRKTTRLPVTVKHRIGIDGMDNYDNLVRFVEKVADAGCDRFIVHARIAILGGLNPRQNRRVPPVRHDMVYQLKKDFPHLLIEINGEVKSLDQVEHHLKFVDGVMIGRAAYENPYIFAQADNRIFHCSTRIVTRRQVIENMLSYIDYWFHHGVHPMQLTRPLMSLLAHQKESRFWKQQLNIISQRNEFSIEKLKTIIEQLPEEVLDVPPEREGEKKAFENVSFS